MPHLFEQIFRASLKQAGQAYILIGIILVLISLLILFVPEILVIFTASIFFSAGILLIYRGWKLKNSQAEFTL